MRATEITSDELVHALVYRRISGAEHQKDGLSLAAQESMTRTYAASKSGWLVAAEYVDIMTGKRADRPQYQAMLDQIRQLGRERRRVVVIVSRLDRLGRNKPEYFRCEAELAELGVEVHSVKDGGRLNTVHAGIMAVLAADESRKIGERVQETRQQAISEGWFSGKPTFGYKLRPATEDDVKAGLARKIGVGVPEIDPVTGPVMKEMFERVARGQSATSAARWIASLPDAERGGRLWLHKNVLQALRSPTYVARPTDGVDDVLARPTMRWQPLVSDGTWQAVQDRLAGHQKHPHQARNKFLLTGFVRCGLCGGRMAASQHTSGRPIFRCQSKRGGAAALDCRFVVSMASAEQAVLSEIERVLRVYEDQSRWAGIRQEWARLQKPADDPSRKLAKIDGEIATARKALSGLTTKYALDAISKEAYDAASEDVRASLEALTAERASLSPASSPASKLPSVETVFANVKGWGTALRVADMAERRDVLALLIDSATLVRTGYGKYEARLAWTKLGEHLAAVA